MSSGIMERNLPVATELGEGDMVRIVTGGGVIPSRLIRMSLDVERLWQLLKL